MELAFQQDVLKTLSTVVGKDIHSLLISGIRGTGKTYLAKKYAEMLGVETFHIIESKVSEIRSAVEDSYKIQVPQVICIENLDEGTFSASYALLKYLEEPAPYVYIVVTCVNTLRLPSTILSRTFQICLNAPSMQDIEKYGRAINESKFEVIKHSLLFRSCKSLYDIEYVLNLTPDKIAYYEKFGTDTSIWKNSTDQIIWSLTHFEDNSKLDTKFVFNILLKSYDTALIKEKSLEALLALESKKISEHATVSKFVLEVT